MKSSVGTTNKRTIRHWKTSEIQYLKDNFTTKTWIEIADHLDRSISSVSSYARGILKLKRKNSLRKNSWSKVEDQYVILNYMKLNTYDISDKIGRSYDAIKARIYFLRSKNQPLK